MASYLLKVERAMPPMDTFIRLGAFAYREVIL